jgi:P-type conjugative transfer protein TrbJ
MTGGSTEWTQISNNIQLVLQYVQQIFDYAMQVQHMAQFSKMTALFKDPQNMIAIASMFTQLLSGLNQVAFSGKSLAEQWRRTHPGEQEPAAAGYRSIEEAYAAIDKDLNRAAEQSLKALDIYLEPENIKSEEAILQALQAKMATADGQARLAQVANELSFEIIRQLTLIRQVLQVQARMTAEDVSAEAQQRLYKREQKSRDYQYRGRYRAGGPRALGVIR